MEEQKRRTRDFFNRKAIDYYEEHYNVKPQKEKYPSQFIRHQRILELVEEEAAAAGLILDGGCGAGVMTCELARKGWELIAVDVAGEMVKSTRELVSQQVPDRADRVCVQLGEVEHLAIPGGVLDGAVYSGVLEYLQEDDALLGEAQRTLKPGGFLIVTARNRLFNLFSMNEYTLKEVNHGTFGSLLEELQGELDSHDHGAEVVAELVEQLRERLGGEIDQELRQSVGKVTRRPLAYTMDRRQHSPRDITQALGKAGLRIEKFDFWHFHPFPPVFEPLSRTLFFEMGLAMEVLHRTPLAPLLCSGVIAKARKE